MPYLHETPKQKDKRFRSEARAKFGLPEKPPTKAQRLANAETRFFYAMSNMGFTANEISDLLKLEKVLHRWHELECGIDQGGIERDEITRKVTFYNSNNGTRNAYPDRETPALKRLALIMAKHPLLGCYVQTDPRGCALYVFKLADLTARQNTIDTCYSSIGLAIGIWP